LDNKPVGAEAHSQLPVFWGNYEEKLRVRLRAAVPV